MQQSNGKTDKFIKFYHSKEWKLARKMVLNRDHYLCQKCKQLGYIKSANTVHHIEYLRKSWSKRLDMSNLETICLQCHNTEHKEKGSSSTYKNMLKRISTIVDSDDVVKFEPNPDFFDERRI